MNTQIFPPLGTSNVSIVSPLPLPVSLSGSDTSAAGDIAANGASVSIPTQGFGTLVFNVSGTWSGTLQPQVQLADQSWVDAKVYPILPSGSPISTISANGQWAIDCAGFAAFQIVSTAWTSGTAVVTLEVASGVSILSAVVSGPDAAGAAVQNNPVLAAGSDGIDVRTLLTDNTGQLKVLVEGGSGGTVTANQGTAGAAAWPTTDKADGTPGSAVPTTAIQAAGSDGTDLRALLTDNTGQLKVLVENAPAVVPNPSAAAAAACTPSPNAGLTVANVKASAGNVYGVSVNNPNASTIYLQFYNTAGTPTLGTSVVWWVSCPPGVTNLPPGAVALANFSTGIGIGAATTATGGSAPVTAPDVVIFYV